MLILKSLPQFPTLAAYYLASYSVSGSSDRVFGNPAAGIMALALRFWLLMVTWLHFGSALGRRKAARAHHTVISDTHTHTNKDNKQALTLT